MRVALNMRVSTDDQTNESQRIRLEEIVNKREWTLVDTYQDQESEAKGSRPGLDQLLRDAHSGRFDLVLVTKDDRISRSHQDLFEIASKLRKYNMSLGVVQKTFAEKEGVSPVQGEVFQETFVL